MKHSIEIFKPENMDKPFVTQTGNINKYPPFNQELCDSIVAAQIKKVKETGYTGKILVKFTGIPSGWQTAFKTAFDNYNKSL